MPKSDCFTYWKDAYSVDAFSADWTGLATIQFLCQAMQETAWHHAEHIGFGVEMMAKNNVIWVLTRQQIRMQAFPFWNDKIVVQTWLSDKGKLFLHRDFEILDTQGNLIGSATTAWIAIDLEHRRPVRVSKIKHDAKLAERPRAISAPWQPIPELTAAEESEPFRVFARDLDMSAHANNANFPEWVLEPLSLTFRANHTLRSLDIAYQAEATHGDTLVPSLQLNGSARFLHCIARPADNRTVCTARSVWEKRHKSRPLGWRITSSSS